jgi:hypothetical protein
MKISGKTETQDDFMGAILMTFLFTMPDDRRDNKKVIVIMTVVTKTSLALLDKMWFLLLCFLPDNNLRRSCCGLLKSKIVTVASQADNMMVSKITLCIGCIYNNSPRNPHAKSLKII